jgi:hypothetical protein
VTKERSAGESLCFSLGMLVIHWGILETTVSVFLATLLKLDKDASNDAVLGNIDFRGKLEIIRAYGFAVRPNDKWYDTIEATINLIDNDLRPRRNAMIHHDWRSGPAGMRLLVNPKPKVKRPQAFKRALEQESKSMSHGDVFQLAEEVIQAVTALLQSLHAFRRGASPSK